MSNKQEIVVMSVDDLEKLIYKTTRKTNSELYKGLANHHTNHNDDMRDLIEGNQYIKTYLQTMPESTSVTFEIDYKILAKELAEEMKDMWEAAINNINEHTKDQINRILGE